MMGRHLDWSTLKIEEKMRNHMSIKTISQTLIILKSKSSNILRGKTMMSAQGLSIRRKIRRRKRRMTKIEAR